MGGQKEAEAHSTYPRSPAPCFPHTYSLPQPPQKHPPLRQVSVGQAPPASVHPQTTNRMALCLMEAEVVWSACVGARTNLPQDP